MVHRIVRFQCETCRARFGTWREADNCELDHITKNAVKEALDSIRERFAALSPQSQPAAQSESHTA